MWTYMYYTNTCSTSSGLGARPGVVLTCRATAGALGVTLPRQLLLSRTTARLASAALRVADGMGGAAGCGREVYVMYLY